MEAEKGNGALLVAPADDDDDDHDDHDDHDHDHDDHHDDDDHEYDTSSNNDDIVVALQQRIVELQFQLQSPQSQLNTLQQEWTEYHTTFVTTKTESILPALATQLQHLNPLLEAVERRHAVALQAARERTQVALEQGLAAVQAQGVLATKLIALYESSNHQGKVGDDNSNVVIPDKVQ